MRSPARSGAPGSTIAEAFEPIVLIATLVLISLLAIEAEAKSNGWRDAAQAANWVISAIFAAEFVFTLVVAPRRPPPFARTGRPGRRGSIREPGGAFFLSPGWLSRLVPEERRPAPTRQDPAPRPFLRRAECAAAAPTRPQP